ncbi:MAG: aldehyde ferredoxin oxidoreductase C-terminal domain-containing protein, partial [Firmicutes bacterium]|nr:aldehyde ferredoxin oxidoreductase C-terminal domain-containing protein [Bacillota bacterium]
HEDCYAVTEALGLCVFTTTLAYAVTPKVMADMWSAATGVNVTADEIMEAGRRIVTVERAFNAREGYDRSGDLLPWRIMNEKLTVGPHKEQHVNSPEEMNAMLDNYYELHGWDLKTGNPTRETLEFLGLASVADELGL